MRKNKKEISSDNSIVMDMELLEIPIDQIKVYDNQPRKEFNEEELKGLADSIGEVGQQGAITVRPIKDGQFNYELVDGERRLRSCRTCGKLTILALVKKIDSEEEQFMLSVAANFCRAEHTPLETADALQRILERICKNNGISKQEAAEKAAKICGHSCSWVAQHLGLLNLCPEVRGLMEKRRIPFQIGVALTNLKSEHQTSFANHIIKCELGFKEALNYVRTHADKDKMSAKGKKRGGGKNYAYFQRFMKNLDRDLEIVADLSKIKKEEMFKNRSSQELNVLISSITMQLNTIKEIKDIIEKYLIRKETTEKAIKWALNRKTN